MLWKHLAKAKTIPGDNVDCWMEIQQGKGPWASPVNGIVPLGTTLTMVVGIDDKEGKTCSDTRCYVQEPLLKALISSVIWKDSS